MYNPDKSEKYFVATDPYYKTMMVFDAEGKKQYVRNTAQVSQEQNRSVPEKQEAKQAEKAAAEGEKKARKKKVSIKMWVIAL
jgi:DNA-binding transcriptional regulator GbsR (MarR family)